jgi:hypothetical protein
MLVTLAIDILLRAYASFGFLVAKVGSWVAEGFL